MRFDSIRFSLPFYFVFLGSLPISAFIIIFIIYTRMTFRQRSIYSISFLFNFVTPSLLVHPTYSKCSIILRSSAHFCCCGWLLWRIIISTQVFFGSVRWIWVDILFICTLSMIESLSLSNFHTFIQLNWKYLQMWLTNMWFIQNMGDRSFTAQISDSVKDRLRERFFFFNEK